MSAKFDLTTAEISALLMASKMDLNRMKAITKRRQLSINEIQYKRALESSIMKLKEF